MTDEVSIVCPVCGEARELSLGLTPNEDGQLLCANCGGEIPIPVAAPDELQDDSDTSPADLPTTVDPQQQVQAAGADSVESLLRDSDAARYVEQETIGKGGMGEIVLCVERNTRRQVAMKRMLPTAAGHARSRARFVEEAQVTAQLEHPNIVPVHELEITDDGTIYFTMKLVKGRSLGEIIQAARNGEETHSLGELLQIFLKVCDGVAFAHSRGVVHRDLKPANIMVGDFGEVLVMDWGVARILGRDEIAGGTIVQSSRQDTDLPELHTMDGSVMGSPQYMPPEQAAGEIDKIDHRSDIYSLGAILYEILTLKRPFEGGDARAIMDKVIRGNIRPPEQRTPERDIPRELSAVAMKCLAKYRGGRYASIPDLQRDVSLYLEGRSVSAAPDTFAQGFVKLVKRNKPVSVAVAAAAVILIALTSVFVVRLKGERDNAVASEQQAVTAQQQQRATALAASQELSERAVRAADQERWAEADISAQAARKMLPDGPWGHYAAGMVALAKKDREAARIELKKALVCDPGHTLSKASLGRIAALEGRLADAAVLLDDPGKSKDWHAFRTAGDTLVSQQRYREAETAYTRALELYARPQRLGDDQKDWRALIAMGDTFVAGEFYADAVAAYARAKEQIAKAQAVPPKIPIQVAEKLKSTREAWEASRIDLEDNEGNARAWVKCEAFYESIKDLGAKDQAERIKAKLKDIHGGDVNFTYDIEDGVLVGVDVRGTSTTEAAYLQPLAHLPLTRLSLSGTNVRDLSPLKGMPLKELNCVGTKVSDLGPLKGMPLKALYIRSIELTDLTPLRGMSLERLDIFRTRVKDLTPLRGMPLKFLKANDTGITDLTPLKGMPLADLQITYTKVSDLGPLRGMPLTRLQCDNTTVSDLGPLKGMPLKELEIRKTRVKDLGPLKGLPLTLLNINATRVVDLRPLKGMGLNELNIDETRVTDLTPLEGMPLKRFCFTPKNITKGIDIVRGMNSIREIALKGKPHMTPEEFWKKYDAGEFK